MSFSTYVCLLLVLVNVCRAGTSAEECKETAVDAAIIGDLKGIQNCLDVGWDANAKDKDGGTALHAAASLEKMDVIAALVKADADVNAKDKYGETALHHAVINESVDAIAALIEAGADGNAKNNDGETALDIATNMNQTDAIQLLSRDEL